MDELQKFLRPFVVGAVFINIALLGFSFANGLKGLQVLSILNMIFLSFALLQEEKD